MKYIRSQTLIRYLQDECEMKAAGVIDEMYALTHGALDYVAYKDSDYNYLYAIGSDPVTLVAHADTVFEAQHAPRPTEWFIDPEKGVLWSPEGAGFDDRAGVLAIRSILTFTDFRPSVIITTGEEIGNLGAIELINRFPQPGTPTKFLIELDRAGHNDAVFYHCHNVDFVSDILNYGFDYATGTYSDISAIAPAWDVAAVNLSIGYYYEHTCAEFQDLNDWDETVGKVCEILEDLQKFPFYKYKEK